MKNLRTLLEEALAKHGSETPEQRERIYGAARRGVAKFDDPVRLAELERHIAEVEETYRAYGRQAASRHAGNPARAGHSSAWKDRRSWIGRRAITGAVVVAILAAGALGYVYRGDLGADGNEAYDVSFDRGLQDFSPSRAVKDGDVPAFPTSVVARTEGNLSVVDLSGENALFTREPITVDPSNAYAMRARFRITRDDAARSRAETYLGIVPYDKSGSEIKLGTGGYRYISSTPIVLRSADGWTVAEGRFDGTGDATGQFPPGTASVRPVMIVNFGSRTSVTQVDYLSFASR
jgi:hypothetical protein